MACPSDDEVLSTLWLMFGQPRNYFCSRWQKGADGTRVTHIYSCLLRRGTRAIRPTGQQVLYTRGVRARRIEENRPRGPRRDAGTFRVLHACVDTRVQSRRLRYRPTTIHACLGPFIGRGTPFVFCGATFVWRHDSRLYVIVLDKITPGKK